MFMWDISIHTGSIVYNLFSPCWAVSTVAS